METARKGPAHPHTPAPALQAHLDRLREVCNAGRIQGDTAARLPFGCPAIDRVLPKSGLILGGVHELLGLTEQTHQQPARRAAWTPPLTLTIHLARRAAAANTAGAIVWIGANAWPFPTLLFRPECNLGARSLFVRAATADERTWAADLALRSGGAAAVVIDARDTDLSASRRLQLAAETGNCPCIALRPAHERAELSAAATRWSISPAPPAPPVTTTPAADAAQPTPTRRWIVELLRCKGVQPSPGAARRWVLEDDRATRDGLVAADLLDRPPEAQAPAQQPHRRSG